jgi:uncharacterized membrane protein
MVSNESDKRGSGMLISFVVGIILGISFVIAGLVVIRRAEPKGCFIYLLFSILGLFALIGVVIRF